MTMNPVMHLTDTVSVMGQVLPEEIATLKAEGFTTVMCNRPDHEDPGQPTMDELAAVCEEYGLRFIRYPLTMMNFPGDDVARMAEEFEPETGKVLAYCRTGTRSANLWILTLAGDARLAAFAAAERYGINTMSARQLG